MRVYLSEILPKEVFAYFEKEGHIVEKVKKSSLVYDAVAAHPDIFMCADTARENIIFADEKTLGYDYPENIKYCAVIMEKYLIHNLKYTAHEIISYAEKLGLEKIHVNQGYTKCSCAVIDGKSIITSDEGIHNALKNTDIDVLKISSGNILLEGHDYGFIGGACGRVGDSIVFCGDITLHPDCEIIRAFIEKRGLKIKYFDSFHLTDAGSIIAI